MTGLPQVAVAGPEERVESPAEGRLITLIGVFKLLTGVMVLLGAAGMFSLLGKDMEHLAHRLVELVRLSPDRRVVHWLYDQADSLTAGRLKTIASVGMLYGLLHCTEGYGLLRRRKWAEELVVVATLIPMPIELYEIFHGFSFKKVLVLALNAAIVAYLLHRRKHFTTHKQRKAARQSAKRDTPGLAT